MMGVETSPTWVIDPNSPADLVRRMQWDRLMNEVLGLFPERLDLSSVYRILEIGCGPGEWTLEAARYFPVFYVGIDISRSQIAYARAMTKVVGYDDLVSFEQVDLTQPLPFADASFDLVHVRFLAGSLPTFQWPRMLHEAWRVLTAGGWVLLSEAEWPTTNSPAAQQLAQMIMQALWKAGYGLSRDEATLGIAQGLPTLLRESGGGDVEQETHAFSFSCGPRHAEAVVNHLRTTAHLMQPFLTRMGYGSQHEVEALAEQMAQESRAMDFVGAMTVLQAWMQKEEMAESKQQGARGEIGPGSI